MATRTGKIEELYVTQNRVYVRLDIPAEQAPLKEYFIKSFPERSGMYSALLAAAANRRTVTLRTFDPIVSTEYAELSVVQVLFSDV